MNLQDYITSGAKKGPKIVMVYSRPGVGKSSAIGELENVVFLPLEDNLDHVEASKLPLSSTWEEVKGWMNMLLTTEHEFKYFCPDSVSSLSHIMEKQVCQDEGVEELAKIPYGKGPEYLMQYVKEFYELCLRLKNERGMYTVMTAHADITKQPNPEGEPFDSFSPKLHKKAIDFLTEKCNAVFFARIKEKAVEKEKVFGQKRYKGVGNGERAIYTDSRPAYMAKCTCKHMPLEMPMDFNLIFDYWDNPEKYQNQA